MRDNEGERDKREINWKRKGGLRETRSRVKAGGEETEKSFWMAREGKAGMPIESDIV